VHLSRQCACHALVLGIATRSREAGTVADVLIRVNFRRLECLERVAEIERPGLRGPQAYQREITKSSAVIAAST
jgi:hypothetical protein